MDPNEEPNPYGAPMAEAEDPNPNGTNINMVDAEVPHANGAQPNPYPNGAQPNPHPNGAQPNPHANGAQPNPVVVPEVRAIVNVTYTNLTESSINLLHDLLEVWGRWEDENPVYHDPYQGSGQITFTSGIITAPPENWRHSIDRFINRRADQDP